MGILYDKMMFTPQQCRVRLSEASFRSQEAFQKSMGSSMSSFNSSLGDIKSGMNSGFKNLGNQVGNMHNDMNAGFKDLGNQVGNMHNDMNAGFSNLGNQMSDGFSSLDSTVRTGINSVNSNIGVVNDNITNMATGLSNQMASSTDAITGSVAESANYLGGQMAENSAMLANTMVSTSEQLASTVMQGAQMISGATFMSAMMGSAMVSRSIKRQTEVLKQEFTELRSEQMLSRRAITAAQMLTYHELKELNSNMVRNHHETMWALMEQSSILSEIRDILKFPRRTEAFELEKTGRFLIEREMYSQALEALLEAWKLVHNSEPGIAVSLAFAYDGLDNKEEFEKMMNIALNLSNDGQLSSYCHSLLSDFYWLTEDKEKALEQSYLAVSKSQNDIISQVNLAATLAEMGEKTKALDVIRELLKQDTDALKPLLDRQSFYRHNLVPEIMSLLNKYFDSEKEELKNKVFNFKTVLKDVEEKGAQKQFKGHNNRFMAIADDINKSCSISGATKKQLEKLHSKQEELVSIEEDARKVVNANKEFQTLDAMRKDVEKFLDGCFQQVVKIIPPKRH